MLQQVPDDVHLFIREDFRLAFCGRQMVLLELDAASYDLVKACKERALNEADVTKAVAPSHGLHVANESARTVEHLQRQGLLVPGTDGPARYSRSTCRVCLHATNSCNLRCAYCYGTKVRKGDGRPARMSKEVAKMAIDFLLTELGPEAMAYEVSFVGVGEPLLNFPLIRWVRSYCDECEVRAGKRIRTWISTNGTLLSDTMLEYFSQKNQGLTISIDGPAEVHDRQRVDEQGNGTFGRVMANVRKILSEGKYHGELSNLWAVLTVTGSTTDLVGPVTTLLQAGVPNICTNPVRGAPGDSFAITSDNVERVGKAYADLVTYTVTEAQAGRRRALFSLLNHVDLVGKMLQRLLLGQIRWYRCDAGKTSMSVDTDGTLYPCSSLSAYGLGMGSVVSGQFDERRRDDFLALHVSARAACRDCWARHLCGGGCHHQSLLAGSGLADVDAASCQLVQYACELAMWMAVQIGQSAELAGDVQRFAKTRSRIRRMEISGSKKGLQIVSKEDSGAQEM